MTADIDAVIKKDFMVKRSLMKGLIKKENYKSRWFVLTQHVLRYCEGTLQVRTFRSIRRPHYENS